MWMDYTRTRLIFLGWFRGTKERIGKGGGGGNVFVCRCYSCIHIWQVCQSNGPCPWMWGLGVFRSSFLVRGEIMTLGTAARTQGSTFFFF